MTDNRYAPPTAKVSDVVSAGAAPAMWNPNAAANWSLLFTPAFGAWLHMKNWQALEEPAKAAASKRWVIVNLVLIVGSAMLTSMVPEMRALDGLSRLIGIVLLLSWYFSSGRGQAEYVKSHFGQVYERRGWGKRLLFALLALIGFIVVVAVIRILASSIQGRA